jgi:hypothetical protein
MVFELARLVGTTVHYDALARVEDVDDLPGCNCFYRREALARVMPTNTALYSNEDVEMNASLRRLGYRLVMTPEVGVQHYKRSSPIRFWRQMHTFAIGRLQLGKRDGAYLKPGHWLAGLGIPTALLAVILGGFAHWAVWVVAVLMALTDAVTLVVLGTVRHSFRVGLHTLLAVVMLLTGWVSGFLRELVCPVPPGPRRGDGADEDTGSRRGERPGEAGEVHTE